MVTFPYTTVLGKLSEILSKIREVGVPDKATVKWLESLGYKSKNDRSVLTVLKFIGFMDEQGAPTRRWTEYRGGKPRKILAEGIREGYSDLFSTYADAQSRSNTDLENFFSTKTTAGKQVITKTVGTFKSLVEIADFSDTDKTVKVKPAPSAQAEGSQKGITIAEGVSFSPSVHIDIQIHISPDTPPEKIDKIFASMSKHIFKQE